MHRFSASVQVFINFSTYNNSYYMTVLSQRLSYIFESAHYTYLTLVEGPTCFYTLYAHIYVLITKRSLVRRLLCFHNDRFIECIVR